MEKPKKQKSRFWIVFVYIGLLGLVIPWYWPADDIRQLWGFPLWSLASLSALFATSLFTAWVFLTGDESD